MKKLLLASMLALGMTTYAQISLGSGTSITDTERAVPFSNYYKFSYAQQIFSKAEINAGAAGNITGIKFYLDPAKTLLNSTQIVVYAGHTTKTSFTSTTDWIPVSAMTQVFSGTISNNAGVVEVTFATPFAYDNVQNLVIAIDENQPGYDTADTTYGEYFYKYQGAANTSIYYKNDNTNPDPLNPTQSGIRTPYHSNITFIGLNPSTIPACPTVTAPADAATGVAIAPTIDWNDVSGATNYKISVGTTPGGTQIVNNFDTGTVSEYVFATDLEYSKQYYYTVTAYNGATPSPSCTEKTFTTRNVPCPTVTLPASNATEQILTPTITWNPVDYATSYTLTVGTTPGGNQVLDNFDTGTSTTYTFATPLNNSTRYYYTVNAKVGTLVSSSCTVRNFTTICTAVTAFSENFDGVTSGQWPTCWAKVGSAGYAYTQTSNAISGPNNLYISGYVGDTPVVAMPPVSTLQTNQYRLKFNGKGSWTSGGVIEVGYLTDFTDATTFVTLGTYTATYNANAYDTFSLDITGVPAGVERLAFRHPGTPGNSVVLDNIVYELIPTCLEPTSFHALSSTQNSIDLEWNPPTTPPAQGYDIRVTNPSTGTVYNFTAAAADLSKTVTGLPNSTTFDVCIRAKCSTTDMSPWVCFTASTLCGPVVPTYANNFTTFPGVCWSYGSGGDATTGPTGTTQEWYADTFLNATSGSNSAKINLWNSGTKGWLITPEFDLTGGSFIVAFDYGMTEYADTVAATLGSDDKVQFLMSTDGGTTWSVINEWTASTPISNTSTAFTHTVTGGTANVKFAFYGTEGTVDDSASPTQNDNDIFIDNFQVISSALGTTEQTVNEKTVKVYPNPFSDILNISDVREVASVTITDMAGRMVKAIAKPSSQLQLGDLKSGMYLVTLKYKDGSVKTVKTIKK